MNIEDDPVEERHTAYDGVIVGYITFVPLNEAGPFGVMVNAKV